MRISFDIDDTLVCGDDQPCDPPLPVWWRWRYPERLRYGTRTLLHSLVDQGCEIWVYTSSGRPKSYLMGWFRRIGVHLGNAVNEDIHLREVGRQGPSKNPRLFDIDLHVDDSDGVRIEGDRHGFHVLVIAPDDPDWTARVFAAVAARRASMSQ